MKKRFNYTSRKKISHSGSSPEVKVSLMHEGGPPFDLVAAVSLKRASDFPKDARLILEATHGPYRERYDLGTRPNSSKEYRKLLRHISPDAAVFKFKIVDRKGILLARSARIKPEKLGESGNENPSDGFISVESVDMDSVWRLRLEDAALPVLEVNRDFDVKARLNADPVFKAAIFPAVLRELLYRYLACADDDDQWCVTVLEFAQSFVEDDFPEIPREKVFELGDSEQNNWINAVIDRYTRQGGFNNAFLEDGV
jgi:hypothetical protein